MNKSAYWVIFSLVMSLNASSLICAVVVEEESLFLAPLPKVSGKPTPRHRRTLSQEQMGNLEELMKTGTGKRNARSRPSSTQYDPSELEELIKEIAKKNGADSAFDDTGNKREFRGGDLEKWKAGEEKWLKRQEERAEKKRSGKDADEGDVNLVLISSFNLNEPVLSFSSYLASEKEQKEKIDDRTAGELLGAELLKELEGFDVNEPLIE